MSRTRSTSKELPDVACNGSRHQTYKQIGDGPVPDDFSIDFSDELSPGGEYTTMNDVVTKDFYTRMKKGEIFNNPMTKESVIYQRTPVTYYRVLTDTNVNADGDGYTCQCVDQRFLNSPDDYIGTPQDLASHSSLPTTDVTRMKDLAVTSAWANIDLSDAAVLASLGEGKETIVSLIDISKRVIKILRAIKRLDLMKLRSTVDARAFKKDVKFLKSMLSPKELSDRYMEYRYALRPLYYDARMLLKALSTAQSTFVPLRQTFRGAERFNDSIKLTETYVNSKFFTLDRQVSLARDITVRAGVLTDVESLSQFNIWGLDQPLETAWELLPFSFIADWFFNIGKTLASWTPEMGVKTLASWVSVEDTVVGSAQTGALIHKERPVDDSWDTGTYAITCSNSYVRTIYTREPDPTRCILPTFKLNLDVLKLVDLGIILKKILS